MLYFHVVRVFRGFSLFLLPFPFNGLRLKLTHMGYKPRRASVLGLCIDKRLLHTQCKHRRQPGLRLDGGDPQRRSAAHALAAIPYAYPFRCCWR